MLLLMDLTGPLVVVVKQGTRPSLERPISRDPSQLLGPRFHSLYSAVNLLIVFWLRDGV